MLQKFKNVFVIRNKENLLNGMARNMSIPYIKSKYVVFLDSDDLWDKNFIKNSIEALKKSNTKASVCLSKAIFGSNLPSVFKLKMFVLTQIKTFFQIFFYYFNKGILPKGAFYLCQMSHMVFEKSVLKTARFDRKYDSGGNDWDFTLKVMDKTPITIIPQKLTFFRYHSKSWIQTRQKKMNKWKSYNQLFKELEKRKIKGLMVLFFRLYINTFWTKPF